MLRSHRAVRLAAAVTALALGAVARSDDIVAGDTVEAIWRVQSLSLEYSSAHSHYACDSLQEKVGDILRAVGAHDSIAIQTHCVSPGAQNQVSLRISLATPVPATEENIRAATTFDGKDELLAQMRKTTLPTPANIARFAATWQTVSLSRQPRLRLDAGDCDLLRNMGRQVFPKIAVRLMNPRLNCNASATRIQPRIEAQALIPAPLDTVARASPRRM